METSREIFRSYSYIIPFPTDEIFLPKQRQTIFCLSLSFLFFSFVLTGHKSNDIRLQNQAWIKVLTPFLFMFNMAQTVVCYGMSNVANVFNKLVRTV